MDRRSPTAADLADWVLALDADESLSNATISERDAAIGRSIGERDAAIGRSIGERDAAIGRSIGERDAAIGRELDDRDDAVELALGWLDRRRAEAAKAAPTREALQLAAFGSAIVGALLGAIGAAGALAFDGGGGRINVVWVLGIFVGLQSLSVLVTVLALLPEGVRDALPGGGGLGLWRRVTVGPIARRWVPASARDAIEALMGRGRTARSLLGAAQRALLLHWSQRFALGFNLGALACLALLVLLTDLAFGWSTTLEVDAATVHEGVRRFAAPWAWAWPAAVPSQELLEATRHFRVNAGATPAADPAVYGRFWPFLFAAIACYGLLPRVALGAVASAQLRAAVRNAFELHPELPRLVARLRAGRLETRSPDAEPAAIAAPDDAAKRGALPDRAFVIDWAEALGELDPALGVVASDRHPAGGACSLAEDDAAIAHARESDDPTLVVVRGYETPVLELRDFLAALRGALGEGRRISFWAKDAPPEATERWARWLAPLGDPWLELVDGGSDDG